MKVSYPVLQRIKNHISCEFLLLINKFNYNIPIEICLRILSNL